jgi:hypothetical protein
MTESKVDDQESRARKLIAGCGAFFLAFLKCLEADEISFSLSNFEVIDGGSGIPVRVSG